MATFEEALFKLWPHGDLKIHGLRQAMAESAAEVFERYGINTKTAMLQFMAQISHECGEGLEIEENLNYSAERMMQVWPSRFPTLATALPYAHNPKMLANKVYNGRMGNSIGTDDGWNFRGRGATQCTGREGYAKLAQKTGLDLLKNPNLVNDPEHFMECGAADFVLCGCLLPALADDIHKVTLRLNGGIIGLHLREQWLARWKAMHVELPVIPTRPPADVVKSEPVVTVSPKRSIWTTFINGIRAPFRRGQK